MSEEDTGDKELLGLAAKAAGFTLEEHYDDDQYYPWCTETEAFWNPLLDDGDAFRLMVKLDLALTCAQDEAIVSDWFGRCETLEEHYGSDRYAATRRGIVNAAAEIGREM